jgi:hypothetical protein
MAVSRAQVWTQEKVMELTRDELLELWGECPAADVAEIVGEFIGLVPNAGDEEAQRRTAEVMYNENGPLGYWMGKAYSPLSKTRGDGYNRWRRPDGVIGRWMRFATEMGTSLIDGKPALMMYYGAYRHKLIPEGKENSLTDEIRKLADGIYLGVGTSLKEDGTRTPPGHFALVGPVDKWQGVDDLSAELI